MSFFLSLKNKLGLISFVILALNFAVPYEQAKAIDPKTQSSVDLLLLSIRKLTPDLVYIEMIQKLNPQLEDKKDCSKISLRTSRRQVKEMNVQENIRKLQPYRTDPQE